MNMRINKFISRVFVVAVCLNLVACAPVLIGTAAVGTTSVAVDRRSAGDVANDSLIETKAALHLTQTAFVSSHITTTSFEGNVLLSGEIGSETDKEKAGEIVQSIYEVNQVFNELKVMPNASLTSRMSDSVTAGKVRAALVDNKDITLTSLKVVVEQGTCYLLGSVTNAESEKIATTASKVSGVQQVVKLFKIISEEELKKRTVARKSTETSDVSE